MPNIPNPPTRDELKSLTKGGPAASSAVERIIGWIEAVNSTLKEAGIGQAPLPMPPGGGVAFPEGQRPLPAQSGEFVVGIVVMLADGTQAVIAPEYLNPKFPSLAGYWKTDGSSSPSTGAWKLGHDLTLASDVAGGATLEIRAGNSMRGAVVIENGSPSITFYDSIFGTKTKIITSNIPPWDETGQVYELPGGMPAGTYHLAGLENEQGFSGKQSFNMLGGMRYAVFRDTIFGAGYAFPGDIGNFSLICFDADAPYTLTSRPTISGGGVGLDGKYLRIVNLGNNPVTIQDDSTLPGSQLKLSAPTITLGINDSIEFMYTEENDFWIQVGYTNTI